MEVGFSNIRLRYSGMAIFGSKILGVFTGLAFTVIVTRNLSVGEFGDWGYLTLLYSYVIIPANFLPYWIIRSYARGHSVEKTSILGNLLLSIPFFFIFLLISYPASMLVEINIEYFFIISSQVIITYLILSLESLAIGRKPFLTGYGIIVFEISKIIFALIFFYYLELGLLGAIIAVLMAYTLQFLFLLYSFKDAIKGKFSWGTLKEWLKNIWLPLYSRSESLVYTLDLFILSFLLRASEPLAFYKIPFSVAMIVASTSFISLGLYAKLLGGGDSRDIEEIFKLTYMFAIPMAVGTFILAEPILHIFRPEYVTSAPILRLMCPWAIIYSFNNILYRITLGTESVDTEKKYSFRVLLKSRLFILPFYKYVRSIFLLILAYIFIKLSLTTSGDNIYFTTAFACFLAKLVSDSGLSFFVYRLAQRSMKFRIPLTNLLKYILCAAFMSIIVFFKPIKFVDTMITVGIGGFIYFGCLVIIDVDSRKLIKQAWKQLAR